MPKYSQHEICVYGFLPFYKLAWLASSDRHTTKFNRNRNFKKEWGKIYVDTNCFRLPWSCFIFSFYISLWFYKQTCRYKYWYNHSISSCTFQFFPVSVYIFHHHTSTKSIMENYTCKKCLGYINKLTQKRMKRLEMLSNRVSQGTL